MKNTHNVIISSSGKYYNLNRKLSSDPMINPELISRLQNKKVLLGEFRIQVLGLSPIDIKRLENVGINTLEDLSYWGDKEILTTIPHFGIKKVQNLKVTIEAYLDMLLNDGEHKTSLKTEDAGSAKISPKAEFKPVIREPVESNPGAEIDAFSQSLNKLEKQLGQLESSLAKARNKLKKQYLKAFMKSQNSEEQP